MKKIIGTFAISLCMILLFASCKATDADTPSVLSTPADEISDLPIAGSSQNEYTGLKYEGIDINPQKHFSSYEVTDDPEFVAELWQELDYESWLPRQDASPAEVKILLEFFGNNGFYRLEIDPNDVGYRKEYTPLEPANGDQPEDLDSDKEYYYDLPKGTYEKVSKLLTDYTSAHYMPEITPDLLTSLVDESDYLVFSSDQIYFRVQTAKTGRFIDKWQLDDWVPYQPPDGMVTGKTIHIYNGNPNGISVYIAIDELSVSISFEGLSQSFEIPKETADIILSQFNEFQNLSEPQ